MFKELLNQVLGQVGSMEGNYIAIITMIDNIETIMTNQMLPNNQIDPELVEQVSALKQRIITEFGEENLEILTAREEVTKAQAKKDVE